MDCDSCKFRLVCYDMGFAISYDDCNPYSLITEKHYVKSIDPTCPKKHFGFEKGYEKGFADGVVATKEKYAQKMREWTDDLG